MLKKSNGINLKEKNGFRPKVVAFIPVRGGSKSIPLKNIKPLGGKPLVYWVVKAASETGLIDKVFVATEDNRIRQMVLSFGLPKVTVVDRKIETTTDTASTESAMLDFARNYDFEYIVLIQATSPLLTTDYLTQGIQKILSSKVDSVISVVRQKRFIWEESDGLIKPLNYSPENRPRRQNFVGFLVENGAFYITSRERLLDTQCRISGNITYVEMPEETYYELDEPSDWVIVEHLMQDKKSEKENQNKCAMKKIKMVVTDCDGVLTDGGMYYSENGDELKKFNTKDGMAIELLRKKGIKTVIITGENADLISRRGQKVKADEVIMGAKNKMEDIIKLCQKYNIELDEIVYIGDDINDLEVIKNVGISFAVKDAMDLIIENADYVLSKKGGEGALREVVELLLASERGDD